MTGSGDRAPMTKMPKTPSTLVIACGALARELIDIRDRNEWIDMDITCVPAKLHYRPQGIIPAMQTKIHAARGKYTRIIALMADCGTGGGLDVMLEEEGVERIAGAHCYEFFAGSERFEAITNDDPTAFYLTDFLVRNFQKLVIEILGIDKHPELEAIYFGNYTRMVYLAQTDDDDLKAQARAAADRLGLAYEYHFTGLGPVQDFLSAARIRNPHAETAA